MTTFPSAFPYQPQPRISPPAVTPSLSIKHFMPLTNGASPIDGPNRSVFSAAPKFMYSPATNKLLSDVMAESRLTFTQRSGLQSILRKGDALPTRPGDIYRQELCRYRHAERAARSLQVPLLPPNFNKMDRTKLPHNVQLMCKFGPGGRRTLDTIQASERTAKPVGCNRRYIPIDKEKEKDRFAHRMATGKDPPSELKVSSLRQQNVDDDDFDQVSSPSETRFLELVSEIKDRLEFMEQTAALGREKDYHPTIIGQIKDLVAQMRTISPERATHVVELFDLKDLLANGGRKKYRPSQVEEILKNENQN